jgi:hypothetical protein
VVRSVSYVEEIPLTTHNPQRTTNLPMALHFNDALDDPLAYDRQSSCQGGMVSWARGNLLSTDQASLLMDVDAETDKVTSNRRGFHLLGEPLGKATGSGQRGAWWFDSGNVQLVLVAAGSELYSMDATHTWKLVDPGALPDSTGMAWGAQVGDKFFLSSSTGNIKAWNATGLSQGGTFGTPVTDGPAAGGSGSALLYLCAQRFRLFGVNPAVRDEVYCSRFLPAPPIPFTLASQPILPFRVGEGEGDPIVAQVPWKGLFGLLTIKAGSVWIVDTSPAGNTTTAATITADFEAQQVSSRVGCVASRSFARTGNDILFLSGDGVRSMARTIADADGAISEPLSLPITDWVRRVNPAALETVNARFWAGRYLLSVPLDNSAVPTHTFCFNIRTGGWMIWTQIEPMAWVTATWRNQPARLCCLDARGNLLEWRDWVQPSSVGREDYLDRFQPGEGVETRVPWRIRTRSLNWGDLQSPKDLDGVEFEFTNSSARIDVDVLPDNGPAVAVLRNEPTGYSGLILPFVLPAVLGERGVRRIPKSLTHVTDAREIVFEMSEALSMNPTERANSMLLRFRSIETGAFFETIPSQG